MWTLIGIWMIILLCIIATISSIFVEETLQFVLGLYNLVFGMVLFIAGLSYNNPFIFGALIAVLGVCEIYLSDNCEDSVINNIKRLLRKSK